MFHDSKREKSRWSWLLVGALWVACVAPLSYRLGLHPNTLSSSQDWRIGKLRLDPPLMGSRQFFDGTQSLEGGRLNLSAWHGFQEVVHRTAVSPSRIEFDFRLDGPTYLVLLLEEDPHGTRHGLRLSTTENRPNARLALDVGGRFIDKTPLGRAKVASSRWHRARLDIGPDSVSLSLNGVAAESWPNTYPAGCRVGFRGAAGGVSVDRIRVWDQRGTLAIREDFSPRWTWQPLHAYLICGALGLALLVYSILSMSLRNPVAVRTWMLAAHLWAAVAVATGVLAGPRILGALYPTRASLQAQETDYVARGLEDATVRLAEQFPIPPGEDTIRVLVVGTSQTAGAGASAPGARFVSRLAASAAASPPPGFQVQVMNGGVEGAVSALLLPVFRDHWLGLMPDLVVFNLGCNDQDTGEFLENLRKMVAAAHSAGARVLLVQEALSSEIQGTNLEQQVAMGELAVELGLPVVDADGAMAALGDVGLMWWDVVHPTDFGHAMLAEILWPSVQSLVQEIAAERAAAGQVVPAGPLD